MFSLLRVKPMSLLSQEASETGKHTLRCSLGATNLITLSIGAGIFLKHSGVAGITTGPQSNRGGNPWPASF
ncbi:MAG TPA: hypothetical protein VGG56_04000 [Terracidiphilus sp.]|jgi:hypothetical protein